MHTSTAKFKAPIFIGTAVLIVGILFKIMRWPYADLLLLIGACGILFFYFLRFFSKTEKVKLDYAKLAVVIFFCIRYVVYVFDLPGRAIASSAFLISLGVFVSLLIGVPFFQDKTNEEESSQSQSTIIIIKNVVVILGIFAIVLGSVFRIMHWPGAGLLLSLGLAITAAWVIIVFFLDKTKEDGSAQPKSLTNKIKNILVVIGGFAIVGGSISKVMHWPGANISLIIGLIIIAVWAIVDLLLTKD
ncbi:MAG: hypothetical protein GQ574_09400 [Crocinitomix sp.]|nr:hypothetical protein [Crocinitomix sp.]